jgi:hypothetical protein
MSWRHQFTAPRLKHEWTGGVSDHFPVFTKVALNKVVSGVEAEEVRPAESGGLLYPLTRHNTTDKLERFEAVLLDTLTTAILLLGGEVFDMEELEGTHELFTRTIYRLGDAVTRVMGMGVDIAEMVLAVHPPAGVTHPVHYGNIWLSRTQKKDRWRAMLFVKRSSKAAKVFYEAPIDKWRRDNSSSSLLRLSKWAKGRGRVQTRGGPNLLWGGRME